MDWSSPGSSVCVDSPGKNTGVGCHALLQGLFPTQGTEPRSPTEQVNSLPSESPGKPRSTYRWVFSLVHTIVLRRLVESTDAEPWIQKNLDGEEPSVQRSTYMSCANFRLQRESPCHTLCCCSRVSSFAIGLSVSSWLSFCTLCLLIFVSWPAYWHKVFSGISWFSF